MTIDADYISATLVNNTYGVFELSSLDSGLEVAIRYDVRRNIFWCGSSSAISENSNTEGFG